jgi:AcrR family transcriptional regulator
MSGIVGEQQGQRRHARRNHELLVVAAREVFAERGVEASLEEIARRAGVGIGTLYRHFATREALVEEIFEDRITEFIAIARAAAAEPDGWQGLVRFLEQMLELQASDRVLKDVLMRYPPGDGRLASAREEMRQLFEQVLDRAREQGRLRHDFTISDLALLFWSFTPLIDATAEVAPNAWRRHLHWLLDGLRNDAATPQAEPPLCDDELHAAMQALRDQRLGRRQRTSSREART